MASTLLEDAILLTLAYSDIFSTPLKFDQLHSRLIGVKASSSQLKQSLNHLLRQQRLSYQSSFYFLPQRAKIVKIYQQRLSISQSKLERVNFLASKLAYLPSILAIYLTGSLAVANARLNDDLDLMLIVKPNQLWTTRFFLNLALDAFSLRRKPKDRVANNKLCLNLYLTPEHLSLPLSKRNLHSAYELIQIKPLVDKQSLLANLYAQNSWFKAYFPNFSSPLPQTTKLSFSASFNPFEPLFFKFQYWHMKPKITQELVSSHFAFFHPQPLYPKIRSQLHQRIIRYNITLWPQLQPFLT